MFSFFKNLFTKSNPVVEDINPENNKHQYVDASNILKDALQEIDQEKNKEEKELLKDKKLKIYLKNCFKVIIKKHTTTSSSFCISYMDVGIVEKYFPAFRRIFETTANSIGLKIDRNGEYIYVNSKDVKNLLEKMNHQSIDIDEKIREMLQTGPYR